jgi:hypothetical protein
MQRRVSTVLIHFLMVPCVQVPDQRVRHYAMRLIGALLHFVKRLREPQRPAMPVLFRAFQVTLQGSCQYLNLET